MMPPSQNALDGLASARTLMANKVESVENRPSMAQPNPISAPSNSPPASSDHLEKIKARLKQSLGKPRLDAEASPKPLQAPTLNRPETPSPQPFVEKKVAPIRIAETAISTVDITSDNITSKDEEGGGKISLEHSSDSIKPWLELIEQLPLKGMAAEVARNSVLMELSATSLSVSIDPEQNYSKQTMALQQFSDAVKQHFGADFTLEFVESNEHFTPVKYAKQQAKIKQNKAEESIQQDTIVKALTQSLGLEVIMDSIKPV